MSNTRRFDLYVTDATRESAKRLAALLDELGADVRDTRGNVSMSAVFRFLVNEKLAELEQKK